MKILHVILFLLLISTKTSFAQNSDDQFKEPLKEVISDIEQRFDVHIRYPEDLVKDRWVTYAKWRFRPTLEETLSNVLTSRDISFTKEGDKKYKLKSYEYYLKTPAEGKEQLQYLSTLYHDEQGFEKRKALLRNCILKTLMLDKLPVKPDSKPIVTQIRKMDGYTVQNIAIETLPGVYVSGSLYRPAKIKGKIPVIMNTVGHFSGGRYRADCQYRCAMLAKMGAMAFSYDLFGWDGESLLQVTPADHRRALVESLQALNATRILDFLLSLKEVDSNRVGITGASGGGSHTMAMTAIDSRIKLSVPVVMMSSYHSGGCPCESGMGIHLCGGGTNNVEIAAMAAPRPQLIISDGKDWTQHVPEMGFPFVDRVYGFYGKKDNVKNVHLGNEGHDYGFSKRKAMYEFVAEHFGLNINAVKDKEGNITESDVTIEKAPAMYVFGDKGERLPANAVKGFENISKIFKEEIAQAHNQRYKVGVIDLMLLKRQKLGAFQVAKDVGADGLEVDMGGLGNRVTFDNKLLTDSIREQFLNKAKELDLQICSLGMTGYYAQSFCERPQFIQSVQDCMKTMKLMNVKVAFLPLGVQCDLVKSPGLRDSVVSRLKVAGKMAQDAGVVIGIETALDATGELKLLQDVGSPAIKSYFNFSNAIKNGRNLEKELRILGRYNIVQIHCTDDDGVWLQNDPKIDMHKVKATLDKMGWSGWLVIERSRDAKDPRNVKKNYGANTAYVKSIFQTAN
ncbi:MAG TPA: TIM barrel protein [Hanamia sp.]|nr:TIM barrel protein [Hanamia sp.]